MTIIFVRKRELESRFSKGFSRSGKRQKSFRAVQKSRWRKKSLRCLLRILPRVGTRNPRHLLQCSTSSCSEKRDSVRSLTSSFCQSKLFGISHCCNTGNVLLRIALIVKKAQRFILFIESSFKIMQSLHYLSSSQLCRLYW